MAKKRRTIKTVPQTLSNSLVLNRFILNLFGTKSLQELSENIKDPAYEGYTEEGVSIFAEQLKARLYVGHEITEDMLLEYDHNIFKHTQEISKNRDKEIKWKYFQYLSLLFTEIYLDKYFTNKEKLLEDIRNYHVTVFNNEKDTNHEIAEFTENDMNKLAFWSATGSGKTLLMHVNILQFQHYLLRAGKKLNKTILITPNEGLTNQHLDEFKLSSIDAQQFSKYAASGFFHNQNIDIIEITKLAETDGDKTIAVDFFEGNNLVLVDEGHRGSSGDKWKEYRDRLSKDGFAFEYSATFGQAISSVNSPGKRKSMLEEYAKATLFDYSYKYFYNDGYGKDYQILNMVDTWDTNNLQTYLTACLLNFYEQLRLYIDKGVELRPFLIERPLAIFVGSSVTADSGAAAERESSDVVIILRFFQRFVKETLESVRNIRNLLEGTDGLVNKNNHSIFTRSFKYLRSFKDKTPEQIYEDILKTVFHCTVSGAVLHLDNLRGLDGEIGMRIGNGDYFGVINVGDASKLVGKCVDAGINAMAKDYTDKSLFESINKPESKINILIGSKKFTEGWSSWRVSTMGLMNVGRSEGSQIIQLFGRGVRLKGYKMSLKRSSALDSSLQPDSKPKYIQALETLNIFGVKADYMEQFKSILEEMGLPANDSDFDEVILPVLPVVDLGKKKLKYLKVKDGLDFKKTVTVTIESGMLDKVSSPVSLDMYAKIQAMGSIKGLNDSGANVNIATFSQKHLSVIDWNKVYFDLIDFKNDKAWYNMNLSLDKLKEIMTLSSHWYELSIPAPAMEFGNYKNCVNLWQGIVTALLKGYVEKAYNNIKSKWMSEHVEVAYLDSSHPNFEKEYQLLVHKDLSEFYEKILQIKDELVNNKFMKTVQIGSGHNFDVLHISGHLYQPLLYINGNDTTFIGDNGTSLIEIRPVPLNLGEKDFLMDIQHFADSDKGKDFMKDKELYLLRNKSKKGIGFFDASGFYPDFIVWLISGSHQYISFVDPKGITRLKHFSDSKIELHKEIKVIEKSLNDINITLNSYIISNTPIKEVFHWSEFNDKGEIPKVYEVQQKFNNHHVYFQREQKEVYIENMLISMMVE